MRFDHLSCNGYHRETSPNIDAFASKSAVFTKAYTPAPWTLPSHTSLFTGLYPSEHQLVSGYKGISSSLSEKIPTLAEIMKNNGYKTIGLSSNPWVGKRSGLNRGFDLYSEYNYKVTSSDDSLRLPSIWHFYQFLSRIPKIRSRVLWKHNLLSKLYVQVLNHILREKISAQRKMPFFAFLNLMDSHNPYLPSKKLFGKFSNDESPPRYKYWNEQFNYYIQGKIKSDEKMRRQLNFFYDASIASLDLQIGNFLKTLDDLGMMDNSLVIVTADHGKTLGEHERNEYPMHYMTDLNRHIPLMVYGSERLGTGLINNVCSLQDIYYFILEETGITTRERTDADKYKMSLTDRINGDDLPFVFSEVKIPFTGNEVSSIDDVYCIDDGRYSYFQTSSQDNILWDRIRDPSQVQDFSNTEPEIAKKLAIELDLWRKSLKSEETHEKETKDHADQETINRLKDLGYL